jgi:hypothetical protein
MNNWNYTSTGQADLLIMPEVTYSGVDSVSLSFDLAAAPFKAAGPFDTLEVLVTKDCGNNFTSVYKKSGNTLRTTTAQPTEFIPVSPLQWRHEVIDLTQFALQSPIIVAFRAVNNKENNIYIDNVNLNTRTLPAALKQQGYLVLPSPFTSSFTVWHYQEPANLRYVNVYTSSGQLVWSQEYNGNASRNINVDLSTRSSGLYYIKLGYAEQKDNKTIKVIKQ